MNIAVVITGINPAPWEAPDLSTARGKGGKIYPKASTTARQRAYQSAIRETIEDAYPERPRFPDGKPFWLRFYVRRQLEQYVTQTGRNQTTHRADSTNIQKSTEDALQGLFFKNDVEAEFVSTVRDQAKDVAPLVVALITEVDRHVIYSDPTKLRWKANALEWLLASAPPLDAHPNIGIINLGANTWWKP